MMATWAVLALVFGPVGALPERVQDVAFECALPADCGVGGVCVAHRCRAGGERAHVALIQRVEVVRTLDALSSAEARGEARRFVSSLKRALAWTRFYAVVGEAVPGVSGGTGAKGEDDVDSERDRRYIALTIRDGAQPGSIVVHLEEADATGLVLSLSNLNIAGGASHWRAAEWVDAKLGRDTGVPGVSRGRLLATARTAAGTKEVMLLSPFDAQTWAVTALGGLNLGPTFAPDGRPAWMSYRDGNADWMVDGVAFSARPGMNAAGAYSPDGRFLALSIAAGANSELVLLDVGTGAEVRVLTDHPGADTSPSWAPDGRALAFVSDRTGQPQIWTVNVDGSGLKRISQSGYATSPAWSPNDDAIVYTARVSGHGVLMRHDLGTTKTSRLSPASMHADGAAFSPYGRYLAFVRGKRGGQKNDALWWMAADGSNPGPMIPSAWPLAAPEWPRVDTLSPLVDLMPHPGVERP